jgi:hypothetical protein
MVLHLGLSPASEEAMRQWTKGELAAGRVTIAQLQREHCSEPALYLTPTQHD